MRYQLICFDAGFTLIEPVRSTAVTLAHVLADEGIPPTEEALRRAWEAANKWFWEEYHRPDNDTWVADERIGQTWRAYHTLMLRELGVDDPHERLIGATIDAYSHISNWQLYPDVVPALKVLRRADRMVGVISDWNSQLTNILDALGLHDYVDFVLTSVAAGVAKPSPAFYCKALAIAGVKPEAALMVGDSYEADVSGARSVGMHAVLLDRAGTHHAADVPVIRSLDELPGLIE